MFNTLPLLVSVPDDAETNCPAPENKALVPNVMLPLTFIFTDIVSVCV